MMYESQRVHMELICFSFYLELILEQSRQHLFDVLDMGIDLDVVDVSYDKYPQHVP